MGSEAFIYCGNCGNQEFECYRCSSRSVKAKTEAQEAPQTPGAAGPTLMTPEGFLMFLCQPGARWTIQHEQKPRAGVQYLDVRFNQPTPLDEARALARFGALTGWMPVLGNYRLSAGPLEIMAIQFIAEV